MNTQWLIIVTMLCAVGPGKIVSVCIFCLVIRKACIITQYNISYAYTATFYNFSVLSEIHHSSKKQACANLSENLRNETSVDAKTYIALLRKSSSRRTALTIASQLQGLHTADRNTSDLKSLYVLQGGRPGVIFTGSLKALQLVCTV